MDCDIICGDLILSWEDSLFSKLIRKVTGSKYSHVGICINNQEFISCIPFYGVCVKKISSVDNCDIYSFKDLSYDQRCKVVSYALSKEGHDYDFFQILVLFYRILLSKLDDYGNDYNVNNYTCSEFVAECFNIAGVTFGKYPDNVLPGTIANSGLVYLKFGKMKYA